MATSSCPICGTEFRFKPCDRQIYCGLTCYLRSTTIVTLEARFRAKLGPATETGCIPWIGAHHNGGYGRITCHGKILRANRLAWELANGPIPPGLHVLHRCDNPPCVNPAHLFLGTDADNMADKVAKDRQIKGEHQHGAKLTSEAVRAIRTEYARGDITQKRLATRYGIKTATICDVIKHKGWKHIV